jgi:magnesium-transporting ATPase (P-type)
MRSAKKGTDPAISHEVPQPLGHHSRFRQRPIRYYRDASSSFIIGTIVLMSVTLDFVQEYRAGQAAECLRDSVVVREQVLRDGKLLEIPLAGMVPRVLRATGEFETNEVSVLYRGVDGT